MSNLKDGFMKNSNKLHVLDSFEQNTFVMMEQKYKMKGKNVIAQPHHIEVYPNYTDKIVYSANPVNSNCFVNASRVEINIPARSNDIIYGNPWLLVRLSETGVSSVTCVPFSSIF